MKKTIKVKLISKKSNWTTLGEVCEKSQYGWTTSASKTGSIKLLRTTDITKGKINWETVPFCQDKPKDVDKYLLKNNDIVISRAGSIGESYILKNVDKSVFASYLIRFTPKNEVNPDYVAYFLKSPLYWKQVREASLGIAIPNINATKLNGFKLPLPERQIQDEIVKEIETQFTRLDAGVAALKRAQANLKRYRAAVLKAACEGKLVSTEAELARKDGRSYETGEQLLQRILAERKKKWEAEQKKTGGKKKYVEPKGPDVSSLPKLPKGWAWATVDMVAFVTKLAGFEYTKFVRYDEKGDLAVLKAENTGKYGFRETDYSYVKSKTVAQLKRSRVYAGDIIMAFVGSVGNTAIVPPGRDYFLGPNIALIRTTTQCVLSKYMEMHFRSTFGNWLINKLSKAVTQASLSMGTIRTIPIPLQPITEQKRIVEEVSRLLSVIEKQEENINEKLKMAGNLKNAILANSFMCK